MGRPSKYNERDARLICDYIRAGANRIDAAGAAGIGETTFHRWLARHADFRQGVMEADATAVIATEGMARVENPVRWLQAKRPLIWGKNAGGVAEEQFQKLDAILKRIDDNAASI